jgi:hypothetical protein
MAVIMLYKPNFRILTPHARAAWKFPPHFDVFE